MAEDLSKWTNVPIEVLCPSATPVLIRTGRITCEQAGACEIQLDRSDAAFEPGMRVILNGDQEGTLRVKGLVTESSGDKLRVETERVLRPDKRGFPRMCGGLRVRYRTLGAGEPATASAAWMAGGDEPAAEGEWREPDPFMDFSGSGLKFEDTLHCAVGDLLLTEFQVPPAEQRYRATARVVRVEPARSEEIEDLDEDHRAMAAVHKIAVDFVEIPREATEALTAFTRKIQDALLRT